MGFIGREAELTAQKSPSVACQVLAELPPKCRASPTRQPPQTWQACAAACAAQLRCAAWTLSKENCCVLRRTLSAGSPGFHFHRLCVPWAPAEPR